MLQKYFVYYGVVFLVLITNKVSVDRKAGLQYPCSEINRVLSVTHNLIFNVNETTLLCIKYLSRQNNFRSCKSWLNGRLNSISIHGKYMRHTRDILKVHKNQVEITIDRSCMVYMKYRQNLMHTLFIDIWEKD